MIPDTSDRLPLFAPQQKGFAQVECRLDHVVKTISDFRTFLQSTPVTPLAHISSACAAENLDSNHHLVGTSWLPKCVAQEYRGCVHPVGYSNVPKTEKVRVQIHMYSASQSASAFSLQSRTGQL